MLKIKCNKCGAIHNSVGSAKKCSHITNSRSEPVKPIKNYVVRERKDGKQIQKIETRTLAVRFALDWYRRNRKHCFVEERVYSSKEDFKYNIIKSKEIIWVSEGLYEFFDWNEEIPPTGEIYEYW